MERSIKFGLEQCISITDAIIPIFVDPREIQLGQINNCDFIMRSLMGPLQHCLITPSKSITEPTLLFACILNVPITAFDSPICLKFESSILPESAYPASGLHLSWQSHTDQGSLSTHMRVVLCTSRPLFPEFLRPLARGATIKEVQSCVSYSRWLYTALSMLFTKKRQGRFTTYFHDKFDSFKGELARIAVLSEATSIQSCAPIDINGLAQRALDQFHKKVCLKELLSLGPFVFESFIRSSSFTDFTDAFRKEMCEYIRPLLQKCHEQDQTLHNIRAKRPNVSMIESLKLQKLAQSASVACYEFWARKMLDDGVDRFSSTETRADHLLSTTLSQRPRVRVKETAARCLILLRWGPNADKPADASPASLARHLQKYTHPDKALARGMQHEDEARISSIHHLIDSARRYIEEI